jgi:hypothetical protein
LSVTWPRWLWRLCDSQHVLCLNIQHERTNGFFSQRVLAADLERVGTCQMGLDRVGGRETGSRVRCEGGWTPLGPQHRDRAASRD